MVRTSVLGSAAALTAVVLLSSSANAAQPKNAAQHKSLALAQLAAGDVVEITTAGGRYRFEIVDTATGEARGQAAYGSEPYSPQHRVFLLGSTHGNDAKSTGMMFVQMHRLRVGMRLELGVRSLKQSDRQLTSPIQTIRVKPAVRDQVAMLVR
jgi:hypothetical protein